jgi:hypothetical protein
MTIQEALSNALEFLEALGYDEGGDIHDDLAPAIARLAAKHPRAATRRVAVLLALPKRPTNPRVKKEA